MSDLTRVVDNTIEPAAVHMYVCALWARGFAQQEMLERLEADPFEAVKGIASLLTADTPMTSTSCASFAGSASDEEMLSDCYDEEEPEDWIVFEGDVDVVSEFQTVDAELSYLQSGAGTPRSRRTLQERVTNTINQGMAYADEVGLKTSRMLAEKFEMADKIVGPKISSKFDAGVDAYKALDIMADQYARDVEENARVGVTAIYEKSRFAAEKYSAKLSELEDRSRAFGQDFEQWLNRKGASDAVNRLQKGAQLVSKKAQSASKAASKAARKSAPDMPSSGAVRQRLTTAFNAGAQTLRRRFR